jgi:hypothetical protein
VRAGFQADFHPKRSGAAWTRSNAARSTPTPRCGRRLRLRGQLGLSASSPCSNRMQAGCAFHLAMRNQGSQPPVSSRSSRDRLVVPASVLAQRLLLRASLRRRPRPDGW